MARTKLLWKFHLFRVLLCCLCRGHLDRVRHVSLDHRVHDLLALAEAQQALQPRFLRHSHLPSRRHLLG
jgi:hypothetical protein